MVLRDVQVVSHERTDGESYRDPRGNRLHDFPTAAKFRAGDAHCGSC